MITLKELNYVNTYAYKTPYPGIKYANEAGEKLINSVQDYDDNYKDKEYDIILSDGSQFTLDILPKNLCHMLGIDYKNLVSEYYTDFRENVLGIDNIPRSYDFLKLLLLNLDKVLEYDYNHGGKIFNYYRMMIKCSIFEKLSDFSRFNFGVINFDKNIFMQKTGSLRNSNAVKLLYVQSNEQNCPYFMMGILKEDNPNEEHDGAYAVETLFAPIDTWNFFDEQKVAIPTQILITSDIMQKLEATPAEKLALLNQYNSIVNQYGLTNQMNIYGDYLATLSREDSEYSLKRK